MKSSINFSLFAVVISIVLITVLSSDDSLENLNKDRPIVEVHEGKLRGVQEKNYNGTDYFYAFRGIPYAKPPVGDLRFKEPEPVEPWSDIRDAQFFGNMCAQFHWGLKHLEGSDDCLHLNVYTTDLTPEEPRATMVSLHGGAFFWGTGNDLLYGPDFLIKKNIVLVTVNYRLGIFGFLNLDDEEVPGNQGLKDQILALKWIKNNIAKFGGDPTRITLFGHSAGAASVHFLSFVPAAQELFHRVILQSGLATVPWASPSQPMTYAATRVARNLGCNDTDTKELIKFLQSVDAVKLADIVHKTFNPQKYYTPEKPFVPSIDSKSKNPILLASISDLAKQSIKKPTIVGYNTEEAIFLLAEAEDDDYQYIDMLLIFSNGKKFLQDRGVSSGDVKKYFMGDKKFNRTNAAPIIQLLQAYFQTTYVDEFLEIQTTEVPDIPVYLYKFDYYSKETAMVQKFFKSDLKENFNCLCLSGTAHAEEIPYLFYCKFFLNLGIEQPISFPSGRIVQQRMLTLWTNFAKTGNPNLPKSEVISVDWKPVDNSTEFNCLKISDNLTMIQEPNILRQLEIFARHDE
ncbi:GSCOCT00007468001.2-RA-CDS [Cotesia congregata]|uniref:Carboxylic ester hydrolase n=1 Tax=Cotesia congregata TaxID=51543 RepID=A0A8J2EAL6_COTCN|nr:GSCOCT00007468001.2-RA-CDS [Cotesia congregata]CAG5073581.1 carboxylesterase clade A member 2 [Cotesia congregata]